MLKGIKDRFKVKSGLKFLKAELENPPAMVSRPKGVRSIGVIVDMDNFDRSEEFYNLITDFNLQPNGVKIIGYKGYYDTNSPYAIPVFSDKDLGWNGDIENSYALEFLSREYDLLINYYTKENLMLQLMTIKTKARLKVGFSEVDSIFNDLILSSPLLDFDTFRIEIHKYLQVMDELKL
ncbi:MAG: hypothetical protein HKN89_02530 [Eudoraea sp.]|nr:hypothetical protein [Eudoraea sp.]